MSTKLNISNIKYYTNSDVTLVLGTMETNSSPPNSITIPEAVTKPAHLFLTRMGYDAFKTAISSAPVTKNSIYCYDQLGNLVGRYEKDRKNNVSGGLSIVSEPVTLLSNIVFPSLPEDGEVIVTLWSYPGLDQANIPSSRSYLLKKDLDDMAKNIDPSRVHLFISKAMEEALIKCGTLSFGKVTVVDNCKNEATLISYLVEYLCGRTISGNQALFQGFINFGDDFEIIGSRSHRKFNEESANVTMTTRRGGRIQVNVDGKISATNFLAILRKKKEDSSLTSINEEITKSSFPVTEANEINGETFSDITMLYLDNFINAIKFQEKLRLKTEKSELLAFVRSSSAETMRYLYANEHFFKGELSSNEFSQILVSDFGNVAYLLKNRLVEISHYEEDAYPDRRRGGALHPLQPAAKQARDIFYQASSSCGGAYQATPGAEPYGRNASGMDN
ncbi:MAG: hypothetical protein EB127_18545 [Alphaproteobacteria bacterium]|nr:hypothetical protein [Alphaproteobacteria bacterium]